MRRGFTMVEILVALAILGMVMGTVGIVLRAGVGSWRDAAELAEESHDAEAVMEQVAMALRSAYYPANGQPDWTYGFQHEDGGDGDSARDSISWVKIGSSLIGEDVPWAGAAHRVNLFVSDGEDGQDAGLYVSAWQIVGQSEDFDPEQDVAPALLSDQVAGLDCRMQDPTKAIEPNEPFEWIDEWTTSNRIPDHVFVQLTMKPRSRGAEPDVLVRMVEIPMSEVSWNPSKPGGGRGGRDRGRRGGEARGAAVKEDSAGTSGTGPASGGGFRSGGGADRGGDRNGPSGPGRMNRGGGGAAPSDIRIEGDRLRIRTGGGK
jgi:prepilin-type N-terminal cleavage/methylation domain-containing protein